MSPTSWSPWHRPGAAPQLCVPLHRGRRARSVTGGEEVALRSLAVRIKFLKELAFPEKILGTHCARSLDALGTAALEAQGDPGQGASGSSCRWGPLPGLESSRQERRKKKTFQRGWAEEDPQKSAWCVGGQRPVESVGLDQYTCTLESMFSVHLLQPPTPSRMRTAVIFQKLLRIFPPKHAQAPTHLMRSQLQKSE